MKSNVEIIRESIENVVNQKKIEKWDDYFSSSFIALGAPLIGIGYSVSNSTKKPVINKIFPGSPSEGKLWKGDELLWAGDEHQRWTTEEEIS